MTSWIWTDKHIEKLKELWAEGLSARKIAERLGQGVTRNAVIGKVHRMKLPARATSTKVVRDAKRKAAVEKIVRRTAPGSMGNVAIKDTEEYMAVSSDSQDASHSIESVDTKFSPTSSRKSLLELTSSTCKWPIGDPTDEDFHFCGKLPVNNTPYCADHAERAFQPQVERKKPVIIN